MELLIRYFPFLLEGLGYNLLLTLLSCIFPVISGVIWILISKTHKITFRIVKWLSLFSECLVPIAVICFVFYGIPYFTNSIGLRLTINAFAACVIGFNLCFIGFLPARQNYNYSLIKNILVGTADLSATVFMWSLVASVIGFPGIVNKARHIIGFTFKSFECWLIVLVISFVVLAVLKLIKYLLEEFLK